MKSLIAIVLMLEPLRFAFEALGVIPTVPYRGTVAALELLAHGAVAAIAAAGAMALTNGAANARRVATLAVILAVCRVLQSLYFSVLPQNTAPGEHIYTAVVALVVGLLMVIAIRRSAPGPADINTN